MSLGRPQAPLTLTDDARAKLRTWAYRPTAAQRLALRARLVLACAEGLDNQEVARRLRIPPQTVGKWRARCVADRLEGLADEPRPGAPRSLRDAQVEEVITRTLERKPPDATHWSTRRMAARTGLSQSAVVRLWQAFGLKPHRSETFKRSTAPFFVEQVREGVGLYLHPPARASVLSGDEQSQVQALDRTQPLLPLGPGQAERHPHDYERHGTASLFAALDVVTGKVIGTCYRRHRQQAFVRFLEEFDAAVPHEEGVTIHLVLDNYGTPKTPRVKRWLQRHPRYVVHCTPTSASGLHQVERCCAQLTAKRLRRGVFRSVAALAAAMRDYWEKHHQTPKPFVWSATADLILKKIQKTCETIL